MMTWRIVMRRRMIRRRGQTARRLHVAIQGSVRPKMRLVRQVIQGLSVGMSLSLLMLILHGRCQESRLKFRILH